MAKTHENGLSLMLMLETGVSRSELLGLRWEDIDEDVHGIRIAQGLVVYHDADEGKQVLSSDGLKNKYRSILLTRSRTSAGQPASRRAVSGTATPAVSKGRRRICGWKRADGSLLGRKSTWRRRKTSI